MTDTLLAAFKKIMSMSDFQTSLIQVAFYGAYFCLAFPAALFIKRFTYKSGVLLGLGLYITGAMLFYPASHSMQYAHFLIALFILAGGLSILETSANPYILVMGPEQTAARRLNLAQSFNPIGALTGVLLSKLYILSDLNSADAVERAQMGSEALQSLQAAELNAVMQTYVGVALLLIVVWVLIKITRMPATYDSDHSVQIWQTVKRILKIKHYVGGVIAQFFYVGAQIAIWSFTIRYVMQELQLNEAQSASYYLLSLVVFSVARFIATWIMKYIAPARMLAGAAVLAGLCTLGAMFGSHYFGVFSLILISAFMSLMFPTIFSLGVRGLGNDTKLAGSGLVMAIVGGAVFTALQGLLSDLTGSIKVAFTVPLICFAVVFVYGLYLEKSLHKN